MDILAIVLDRIAPYVVPVMGVVGVTELFARFLPALQPGDDGRTPKQKLALDGIALGVGVAFGLAGVVTADPLWAMRAIDGAILAAVAVKNRDLLSRAMDARRDGAA